MNSENSTDFLVIGCGVAGMSAACRLAKAGKHVIIAACDEPFRSQSVMAAGGMNAAMDASCDSPEEHARDTLEAGCGLADERAVLEMTKAAPGIVEELARLGILFSRERTDGAGKKKGPGKLALRKLSGQTNKRTVFAGLTTGKQIVAGMYDTLMKYASAGLVEERFSCRFISPVIDGDGTCLGAILENTANGSLAAVRAGAVILASGGMCSLFSSFTGSVQNDAAVTASFFAKGVKLANAEMIQYHPTTVRISRKNILISEAVRSEGGRLFTVRNGKRCYFMEENFAELGGNLAPRSLICREIEKIYKETDPETGEKLFVGLETESIPENVINKKLEKVRDMMKEYCGTDISKEFIPVSPAVHYTMGGFYVDRAHRTTMKNVYAAGECACIYNGAERLGGNSLPESIYGGCIAAETAMKDRNDSETKVSNISETKISNISETNQTEMSETEIIFEKCASAEIQRIKSSERHVLPSLEIRLKELMMKYVCVSRNGKTLEIGLSELEKLEKECPENCLFREKIILAQAIVKSALAREESRGAHFRTDFPETDEKFRKTTVASFSPADSLESPSISISFEEIGRDFA